jgi:ParB family chromosome partitioning protein
MGKHAKQPAKKPAKKRRKKAAAEAASRGIDASEAVLASPPPEVRALAENVAKDGGAVIGAYKDPLGGKPLLFVALPLDRVAPTPFQRDLSQAHVDRLTRVIDDLDRFLDPIIALRNDDGSYWTPNGHHRTAALRQLGARSIVALLVPDPSVAYRILALNTEKAHNLREKSLEVIRMARSLAELDPTQPESAYAIEFEEAPLVTLGACYDQRGRFSGSTYHPVLRRTDGFLDEPLPSALEERERRAKRLLELDDAVVEAVAALKAKGFESPYLKAFVVARVNPLRFKKGGDADFDETIDTMIAKAKKFDSSKIDASQLAASSGPPEERDA